VRVESGPVPFAAGVRYFDGFADGLFQSLDFRRLVVCDQPQVRVQLIGNVDLLSALTTTC
jgi:hypothetical protein